MTTTTRQGLLALFVALPACAASAQERERAAVRVVEVSGTPYERGHQHGQALKEEIDALFTAWDAWLREGLGVGHEEFVPEFLAATRFDDAARRWTPELLDEVRGIAAGCERDYDTMLAWQLVDEVWVHAGEIVREKCTTIGIDRIGDQPAFVAQNIDIPLWYQGHQTVLRVCDASRDLQSLVVTVPGIVGAAGVNSARVAVGVNTLLQLKPCRDGLPVAFVVRGLLACQSHEDALRFLREIKHASGQNYTLGGPETAPGFECSANEVSRYRPYPEAPFTFHTNHPLVNDDFAAAWTALAEREGTDPFALADCPRWDTCARSLPPTAEPDIDAVIAVLASRSGSPSVCNDHTFCCIVMVLDERPTLRISAGGADRNPFEVLRIGEN